MRIAAKHLPLHLKQNFAPFYFVFGDDPLQYKEAIETIRATAKQHGYIEREIHEITLHSNSISLLASLNNQSLFSDKRFIEYRITDNKISATISDFLNALTKISCPPGVILLLTAAKLDKKSMASNWFLELEKKACVVVAHPLTKREALGWIENRLRLAEFNPTPEVIQVLFERTEGNLLAAAQCVEKLSLLSLGSSLTTFDISKVLHTEARFSIYDLVDTALSGKAAKTAKILANLKEEGIDPTLINWAITREVRTLLQLMSQSITLEQSGIWKHRQPLIKDFMSRFSILTLEQILIKAKSIDDIIKGRLLANIWDQLLALCLSLTGSISCVTIK